MIKRKDLKRKKNLIFYKKMVSKNIKIFIGLIFFTMFITVSIVSAKHAWWHPFSDEPALAPFNATVTIQSVAPTIPIVFNVSDDYISSTVNEVQVTPGKASNVYVVFLADDSNGNVDLPTVLTIGTDVRINITYTGNRPENTFYVAASASADSCFEVVGNGPNGACGSCSTTQRMYMCNMSDAMQYYYQPNINLSVPNPLLWKIEVDIFDLSGSATPGRNLTRNFTYLERADVENQVNLSWVGIAPTGINQRATQNVTLINRGNKFIHTVNITSFNLTGNGFDLTTNSAKRIPSRSIRASGQFGSECGAAFPPTTTLAENAGLNVTGLSLDYNSSSTKPILFCIFPALASLPESLDLTASPYIAANGRLGTADWRLQLA